MAIKSILTNQEDFTGEFPVFFARPISLFVQSGFCSAPDREFYAL